MSVPIIALYASHEGGIGRELFAEEKASHTIFITLVYPL